MKAETPERSKTARRAYRRPVLVTYGDIREITRNAGGGGTQLDGSFIGMLKTSIQN